MNSMPERACLFIFVEDFTPRINYSLFLKCLLQCTVYFCVLCFKLMGQSVVNRDNFKIACISFYISVLIINR